MGNTILGHWNSRAAPGSFRPVSPHGVWTEAATEGEEPLTPGSICHVPHLALKSFRAPLALHVPTMIVKPENEEETLDS